MITKKTALNARVPKVFKLKAIFNNDKETKIELFSLD
jgi:hypothetical protein